MKRSARLTHPVAIVEGITNAVEHPVETAKNFANGAVDTAKAAANADPKAFGQVVGTVALPHTRQKTSGRSFTKTPEAAASTF